MIENFKIETAQMKKLTIEICCGTIRTSNCTSYCIKWHFNPTSQYLSNKLTKSFLKHTIERLPPTVYYTNVVQYRTIWFDCLRIAMLIWCACHSVNCAALSRWILNCVWNIWTTMEKKVYIVHNTLHYSD